MVDVIGITEFKTKNCTTYGVNINEYNLDGFDMFYSDSDSNGKRGVIIYAKKYLHAQPLSMKTSFNESVWVSITTETKDRLVLGCVYRSPNSSNENNDKLALLIRESMTIKATKLIIMGDFNLPGINWKTGLTNGYNPVDKQFLTVLGDNFLCQHVDQPTRFRDGQKPSLLDLIITNDENVINEIRYREPLGKSDHLVLEFEISQSVRSEPITVTKLIFDKGDYDAMRADLRNRDLCEELKLTDTGIDAQWKFFTNLYQDLVEKYIPERKIRIGGKNKKQTHHDFEYDSKINRLVKRKRRLWKRYMETKSSASFEKYRKSRNKLKNNIKAAKRKVIKKIAKQAKSNPKQFWAYVNKKNNNRDSIPNLEVGNDISGNTITTETTAEKANLLAEYFTSVFTQEKDFSDIVNECIDLSNITQMSDIQFKPEEIFKKLINLKISKSPGPDQIHPRVLKEIANEISPLLCTIFNNSIENAVLPCDWKIADVTPIFKKGDKKCPENYRPISLTSVVCKILESLIRDRIEAHLRDCDMLSNKQYGFLKGRSTILQLLKVFDNISEIIDTGVPVDIIYTDFKKAFDSVPHNRLLIKLKRFGLPEKLISWIKQFLIGRQQRVKIEGVASTWSDVESGVPQGSVLGPLLFVLFINDIVEDISCNVYLYADDMKIFTGIVSEGNCKQLQQDIDTIVKWTAKWQLELNADKCKALTIYGKHNQNTTRVYHITDNSGVTPLANSNGEKDLGIFVDQKLSFELHIIDKVKKANRILGLIKRNFKHIGSKAFIMLYKALVRSHLEYGQNIWSPYKQKHVDMLEKVQKRATKIIPGFWDLSYSQRLAKLRLPTLVYRRLRGDMIETYKIIHELYDKECCPKLLLETNNKTRGHRLKLHARFAYKNVRHNFFTVRVVETWNSLPSNVVEAPSVNTFKDRLDKYWSNQEILTNYKAKLDLSNKDRCLKY